MSSPSPQNDLTTPKSSSPAKRRWHVVLFALKAVEIRLRFIAILVGIGLLIGYWDTLRNYWDKWTRPEVMATAAAADEEFYCPMHPKVVRPTLEPDGSVPQCPICGMKLSKRKRGEAPELPPGIVSRVQLSPERIQLAGIGTTAAEYRPLAMTVRTVGFVEYDESRLSKVVTRTSGYIERLYVDKTWETVKKGEPLAELYSPELYSTSQELLVAQKRGLKELVNSGRERLQLLGVGEQEIEEILQSGQAGSRIVIRAPQSGHVVSKNIVQGASVTEGMTLFEVADLTVVWIEADVYEKDTVFLKVGQEIEATVQAFPNRAFQGTVSLVHPHVERETRTNRVRFELPNPRHELRPGMYAMVEIRVPMAEIEPFATRSAQRQHRPEEEDLEALATWQKICPVTGRDLGSMGKPVEVVVDAEKVLLCCAGCVDKIESSPVEYLARLAPPPADQVLAIPQNAVIDTGSHQIVYVEREPGVFEGVEVQLGPRSGDLYPVISGLSPGDRIAAAGAFLIDAETRLNPAAGSTYFGASGTAHSGHSSGNATTRRSPTASTSSAESASGPELTAEQLKEIAKLAPADQEIAREQTVCPVSGEPLGSMGMPFKVSTDGKTFFLCCEGCEGEVKENFQGVLQKLNRAANSGNQ